MRRRDWSYYVGAVVYWIGKGPLLAVSLPIYFLFSLVSYPVRLARRYHYVRDGYWCPTYKEEFWL